MHKYEGIRPLADRILVEVLPPETKTKGGILVPAHLASNNYMQGIVRAVGPGKWSKEGKRVPMLPLFGERVMLDAHRGSRFKAKGKRYIILHEYEIVATLSKSSRQN